MEKATGPAKNLAGMRRQTESCSFLFKLAFRARNGVLGLDANDLPPDASLRRGANGRAV
jgi:hypothetical protein